MAMLRGLLAAALLACACGASIAQQDTREADAARIMEVTGIDRLILANARSSVAADPKSDQALDEILYRVRPPALWGPKHPAWQPAKDALRPLVAAETHQWVQAYWQESALKTHIRELAYSYRVVDMPAVRAFAESAGGAAWFARRVAEARAKSGEAFFSLDPASPAALEKLAADARKRFDSLPAAEKQRVAAFVDGRICDACGVGLDQVLERYIAEQSRWIADVLLTHLGGIEYRVSDRWVAQLDAKLANQLPVDSKKQILGTLEMRADATLVFRFTFHWKDSANGGALALEFPRSAAPYAEVLALAPGIAPGQSRVLYRDKDGEIGDKP